jgi:hypothetical protein
LEIFNPTFLLDPAVNDRKESADAVTMTRGKVYNAKRRNSTKRD